MVQCGSFPLTDRSGFHILIFTSELQGRCVLQQITGNLLLHHHITWQFNAEPETQGLRAVDDGHRCFRWYSLAALLGYAKLSPHPKTMQLNCSNLCKPTSRIQHPSRPSSDSQSSSQPSLGAGNPTTDHQSYSKPSNTITTHSPPSFPAVPHLVPRHSAAHSTPRRRPRPLCPLPGAPPRPKPLARRPRPPRRTAPGAPGGSGSGRPRLGTPRSHSIRVDAVREKKETE